MKGQILNFSIQESRGVITGDDGKRYEFAAGEWKENCTPERGMAVDFDVNAEQKAIGVYLALQQSAPTAATSNNTGTKNDSGELSLFQYAIHAFTEKYATVNGRARRKEFWGYYLFKIILFFAIFILCYSSDFSDEALDIVASLLSVIFFVPDIAIGVRRLHDIGKSGWWWLIAFIPLIGIIVLLIFWCQDSNPDDNQYGSNPKNTDV